MITIKIGFFAFRVHFDPLKLRFSQLFLYYRYRSECCYLPLKTALEAVGDKNRPKFFKANFNPLKFLRFFWLIMAQN